VNSPAFTGSRKPLLGRFRVLDSGGELVVVNVHLASKRHQNSIFAPTNPGHDEREAVRVQQAQIVRDALADERREGTDFYVTGDFNDFEFSATLRTLCGDDCVNMVETLPHEERYDYNHRGQLQVLMHGVVSKASHEAGRVGYEIIHGNELSGVKPGSMSGKATDHAYVLARIAVKPTS
jgi:predicted extracellular nuclease